MSSFLAVLLLFLSADEASSAGVGGPRTGYVNIAVSVKTPDGAPLRGVIITLGPTDPPRPTSLELSRAPGPTPVPHFVTAETGRVVVPVSRSQVAYLRFHLRGFIPVTVGPFTPPAESSMSLAVVLNLAPTPAWVTTGP